MKLSKRLMFLLTVTAATASFYAPSAASGAVEFGDNCVANKPVPAPYGLFGTGAAGNPLPPTAPVAGVLTSWKINVVSPGPPAPFPVTMKVLRRNPAAGTALITGEADGGFVSGTNVFPARISVQPGDILGLVGSSEGVPICDDALENGIGIFDPTIGVGGSAEYVEGKGNLRIPVFAVIEPDADNDGFGDETQDLCPQSAAFQIACPLAALDAVALKPGKRFVKVLVSASSTAPVSVIGTVNLGKGAKATLKAGPKTVTGGTIGRFTLRFPGSLKERLGELEPKRKLTLRITASATNVAGQVSTDKTKVKLKGLG